VDLVVLPVAATLNAKSGGAAPTLQPGQVIDALVARVIDAQHVQLALGSALIEARTEAPLLPGARVQLAVKATPEGLQLVLVRSPDLGAQAAARSGAPASGSAEAVRDTGANAAAAPVRSAAETSPSSAGGPPANTALATAVRSAAAAQDGLSPLLADAAAALRLEGLPAEVRGAVRRLLSFQIPGEGAVAADQLRRAFARSGLFLEANLDTAAATAQAGRATAVIPDDMKAALAALRQSLTQWSANNAPVAPAGDPGSNVQNPGEPPAARTLPGAGSTGAMRSDIAGVGALYKALLQAASGPLGTATAGAQAPAASAPGASAGEGDAIHPGVGGAGLPARPPPPYRGALPVAQPAAQGTIVDGDPPETVARTLLAETEAALARHTLLQAASLPDQPGTQLSDGDGAQARWAFEIPFALPQGTAIAQFEIARDGAGRGADPIKPVWRARFSIDLDPLGAVHAQVAVTGERAAVTLWAEREASSALLRDNAPLLAEALRSAEIEPSELVVRVGSPRQNATAAAPAGRFLDRAS
jgi:hypothetical protein